MRIPRKLALWHLAGLVIVAAAGLIGCGNPTRDQTTPTHPLPPKQASVELRQAFVSAPEDSKKLADVASEALRTENYETAVESLVVLKENPNLSLEQGLAVHASEVGLEAKLISAVQSGDAKARQAYELLKKSRKN